MTNHKDKDFSRNDDNFNKLIFLQNNFLNYLKFSLQMNEYCLDSLDLNNEEKNVINKSIKQEQTCLDNYKIIKKNFIDFFDSFDHLTDKKIDDYYTSAISNDFFDNNGGAPDNLLLKKYDQLIKVSLKHINNDKQNKSSKNKIKDTIQPDKSTTKSSPQKDAR